jgi:hypothetical protein
MKLLGYYNSIDDMKLYNWIKCTGGDLKYARIEAKGNEIDDKIAWGIIYDSYIKEFGLSPIYIKLLNAIKDKTLLELEYVITKDRFKLTEIEIALVKLQSMMANNGSGMSIEEALIHVSKWMGNWIDAKNITVRDYFNLMKEYGKANKVK